MIFGLAVILTALALLLLLVRPYTGFLLIIASKPLIDMTWEQNISGFNLLKVVGVMMPILLVPRLLACKYWRDPKNRAWLLLGFLFFASQIVSVVPFMSVNTTLAFDLIFRTFNGLLAFLMIPAFATSDKRLKQILLALIIAGVAPALVSIYGQLTGTVWHERSTVGLSRNIGLYQNGVSIRHFGLQSIIVALMYFELFKPKKTAYRGLLLGFLLASVFMLYLGYSRGAVMTLVTWFVIWMLLYRKIHWGIMIAVGIFIIDILIQGRITQEITQLFSKEISFYDGSISDSRRVLNGRYFVWEAFIDEWKAQEWLNKLVGGNYSGIGTHNEFLRSLMANGIVGAIIYVGMLVTIMLWTIKNFVTSKGVKLTVYTLMFLSMYFIEAAGSTPSLYPQYLWVVFGMIGMLLLNGHQIQAFETMADKKQRQYQQNRAMQI